MKRILLAAISFLPLLSFGQSMKISPKQLEPGLNGQIIVTRNDTNKLDSLKWTDISGVPGNLERTSNKVTNANDLIGNVSATQYPSTQTLWNTALVFKGKLANGDDLGAYTQAGTYYIPNSIPTTLIGIPPNYPSGGAATLIVLSPSNNSSAITQILIPSNTNYANANANPTFWIRQKVFSTQSWSDWQTMTSREWVASQGFLTAETDPVYAADKGNLLRLDNGSNTGVVSAGNIDLNAILNTSIVRVAASSPNTPFVSDSGGDVLTKIYRSDHNYVTQFAQEYSQKPKAFIRNSLSWSGGTVQTWYPWKELLGDGDNISRFNNDAGYITSSSIPAAQVLSLSGQNLSLSGGGGTVTLPTGDNIGNSDLSLSGNRILSGNQKSFRIDSLNGFFVTQYGTGSSLQFDQGDFNIGLYAGASYQFNPGGFTYHIDGSDNSFQYFFGSNTLQLSNGTQIATLGMDSVTGITNLQFPPHSGVIATISDIPTVSDATLTLSTSIYGTTSTRTWTANHATDKTWSIIIPQISTIPEFNSSTGFLKVNNSTLAGPINDSVQLLSKINDKGYLQPTTGLGVNTGGGFAATAQTEAFNSTYIDISDGTYTLYIVPGGNPSGGDIKLVNPNEIPDRIIRIVNTSGATGTFINAPILGLTSSSVTTIHTGQYIVIQSVINPSSGDRMWAQVGGNY